VRGKADSAILLRFELARFPPQTGGNRAAAKINGGEPPRLVTRLVRFVTVLTVSEERSMPCLAFVRYSERHTNDGERFRKVLARIAGKRLTYARVKG